LSGAPFSCNSIGIILSGISFIIGFFCVVQSCVLLRLR